MGLTAGALSKVSAADVTISASSTAPTGGTTPYLYQWYRSTVSGFTPSTVNAVSGATSAALSDSSLIPNTPYYYKVVYTDSNATPLLATSAQLSVSTIVQAQQPNSFTQQLLAGQLDLRQGQNVISCEVDPSVVSALFPGQAVKIVSNSDGVPKVIGAAAANDPVFGVLVCNKKDSQYNAGDRVEVAINGTVIYMWATGAIARGAQACLDVSSPGAVQATGNTASVMGIAIDKFAGNGSLGRILLLVPNATLATA